MYFFFADFHCIEIELISVTYYYKYLYNRQIRIWQQLAPVYSTSFLDFMYGLAIQYIVMATGLSSKFDWLTRVAETLTSTKKFFKQDTQFK